MSAQTAALRQLSSRPVHAEGFRVRILYWSVALPVIMGLGLAAFDQRALIGSQGLHLASWLCVVAITDLLYVPVWGNVVLTMSLPVLLAAGMVLPPPIVGLLAFLGSVDERELRREVSLGRAIYNRSQVALSAIAGSLVFHGLGGDLHDWPIVLSIVGASLTADFAVNCLMVAAGARLITGLSIGSVIRRVHGSAPMEHIVAYVALGLLAIVIALCFEALGEWGFLACLAPLVLARQTFLSSKRFDRAAREVERKERALRSSVEQISDERRDERISVAGGLHDEVLQPLYQVHLMGQVLRRDLESGRLLDLDIDLPQLLDATESAQRAIRSLIRDLRTSTLGPDGLATVLKLFVRELDSRTAAQVSLAVEEIDSSPAAQLLAYQFFREILQNAVRHANADSINARVWTEPGHILAKVEDDGVGFYPDDVDTDNHFGIALVRERIQSAGGTLLIESAPGCGTTVAATIPTGWT